MRRELHRETWGKACCGKRNFPPRKQEFITTLKLKPDLGEAYGDLAFAASGENKGAITRW